MNEELESAAEILAEHLNHAESGTAYCTKYASTKYPGIKITVSNLFKKPMLNYAEALEIMKDGIKVRIFNESEESHNWIEYVEGKGFLIMTNDGLIPWNPAPTINELQLDCFVIVKKNNQLPVL